jgi:hypothetical protein
MIEIKIGDKAVFVLVDPESEESMIGGPIVAVDEGSLTFRLLDSGATLRAVKGDELYVFDEASRDASEWDLDGEWGLWIYQEETKQ